MFHLADDALTLTEIDLLEDTANVEPDGLLWYEGTSAREKRALFNGAEILLFWTVPDAFGVQRITVGVSAPISVARWRARLRENGYGDALVAERQRHVNQVFPAETVSYVVVGWRVANFKYWNPRGAHKVPAEVPPVVEDYSGRDSRYIRAPLAKRSNEKN